MKVKKMQEKIETKEWYTDTMEIHPACSVCHTEVRDTDYFCFNCGKNLHEKPLSITVMDQVLLYAGSLLLPPMGILWGIKYLKQQDQKSRYVGIVAIAITVIVILWITNYIMNVFTAVNSQVNTQLDGLGGF